MDDLVFVCDVAGEESDLGACRYKLLIEQSPHIYSPLSHQWLGIRQHG